MKNKYLSLLFASFLVISGCETIGGSRRHQILHHMNTEIQNKLTFRDIFKMRLEIGSILKQINITLTRPLPSPLNLKLIG